MPETQRKPSSKPKPKTMPANAPAPQEHVTVEELDELLDEIDTCLEENSWVERYRQRGGQ